MIELFVLYEELYSFKIDMEISMSNEKSCHDLAEDPENKILLNGGWNKFDHFVFVTQWQRDQYIGAYDIPYAMCSVIPNAVEKNFVVPENNDHQGKIKFIYHTIIYQNK